VAVAGAACECTRERGLAAVGITDLIYDAVGCLLHAQLSAQFEHAAQFRIGASKLLLRLKDSPCLRTVPKGWVSLRADALCGLLCIWLCRSVWLFRGDEWLVLQGHRRRRVIPCC
jgi:hypothetical protein